MTFKQKEQAGGSALHFISSSSLYPEIAVAFSIKHCGKNRHAPAREQNEKGQRKQGRGELKQEKRHGVGCVINTKLSSSTKQRCFAHESLNGNDHGLRRALPCVSFQTHGTALYQG